uniref:THAP-type domain-containing protein n=1 Tax=Neogobius melanostomus TaxID=47308 RepID=A0A8C6U0Y8_9GOBI
MPSACCAMGCTNALSQKKGLAFDKFPKDPVRRQKWITLNCLLERDECRHMLTFAKGNRLFITYPSCDQEHFAPLHLYIVSVTHPEIKQ